MKKKTQKKRLDISHRSIKLPAIKQIFLNFSFVGFSASAEYISASQKSAARAKKEIKNQDTCRLIKQRFHEKAYPEVATELDQATSPNWVF